MEISARINPISYEKPYYRRKNLNNIVRKGEKGEIFFLGGVGWVVMGEWYLSEEGGVIMTERSYILLGYYSSPKCSLVRILRATTCFYCKQ